MTTENHYLKNDHQNLKMLILSLQAKFGRFPTEEEVLGFIYGDREEREQIWNSIDDTGEEVMSHEQG